MLEHYGSRHLHWYFISFLQVPFSFFASFNNMSTLRLRAKVVISFYATTNYCRNKNRNGRKKRPEKWPFLNSSERKHLIPRLQMIGGGEKQSLIICV